MNPLASFRMLILIAVSLSFLNVIPARAVTEGAVPREEMERVIRQKLGPAYVLRDWSYEVTKQFQKGPIKVRQLALEITVELKEPLYVRTHRQNDGRQVLRRSRKQGERIVLTGGAMLADTGGFGANQMQVMISPGDPNGTGLPLNGYPQGYVVVAGAGDSGNAPIPSSPESQQVAAQQPAPPGPVQRLWEVFGRQHAVWGRETWGVYRGSPVVLHSLNKTGPHTLKGVIEYPGQELSNPFVLMGTAGSLTLKIEPAERGVPPNLYNMTLEDEQLVARRGPVFPLSLSKSEAARKDFERARLPWNFEGDISDYVQLDATLININSLEPVSKRWGNQPLAPVTNLPGRFWNVSANYQLGVAPFGAYPAEYVHTQDPKRTSLTPFSNVSGRTWVASDLLHYVSLKEGDLWGGTIDWKSGTAMPPRNLTNIGLLNDLEPIAWCERSFYFLHPQATDRPVLRIDTQTGDVFEMKAGRVIRRGVQGSPDGCLLFTHDDGRMISTTKDGARTSQVHVLDLRSDERFDLDATYDMRNYAGKRKMEPRAEKIVVQAWVTRDIFWTRSGWYDLGQRKRVVPSKFPRLVEDIPYAVMPDGRRQAVPGDRYMDVVYRGLTKLEPPGNTAMKRYRIDRLSGEAVELPLEPVMNRTAFGVTWVDKDRYVYARRKGALSEIGTWLYDVHTGMETKLSRFFADEHVWAENARVTDADQAAWSNEPYITGRYLVLPDKNRIIFSSTRGSVQELVSVSLDGKELLRKPIAEGGNHGSAQFRLRRLYPFPVSLPLP